MSSPLVRPVSVVLSIAALLTGGRALCLDREPETALRCICVDGAAVEWVEGSTVGPPGRPGLDWPGARPMLRCRPQPLPTGAPGEKTTSAATSW